LCVSGAKGRELTLKVISTVGTILGKHRKVFHVGIGRKNNGYVKIVRGYAPSGIANSLKAGDNVEMTLFVSSNGTLKVSIIKGKSSRSITTGLDLMKFLIMEML